MAIEGYYLNCDDAVCVDCAKLDEWAGFEDWDEPLAIFSSTEVGSPVHCVECGVLLDLPLVDDGISAVIEALIESVRKGARNPVTQQWLDAYEQDYDFEPPTLVDYFRSLPLDPDWYKREDLQKYVAHIDVEPRELSW